MNFNQMHERLRLEVLRRIQRGTLSVSLLGRQTGYGQSHISNFLHGRRQLSLDAMDRVLVAQHLTIADLLPEQSFLENPTVRELVSVPIVSAAAAMYEPHVRASGRVLQVQGAMLQQTRARAAAHSRTWERFVGVAVPEQDAEPMYPLLQRVSVVLLDRHYNSLAQYRPDRPNLYAIRNAGKLTIRYAELHFNCLVLRPHARGSPLHMVELAENESPGDLIVGRVVLIVNEL